MREYKVTFQVFNDDGSSETKIVKVIAGNIKLATIRAMSEINKIPGYSNLFKKLYSVEEVKMEVIRK